MADVPVRTDGVDGERLFDVDVHAPATVLTLNDRYTVPPFTVLDTRQGYWVDRRREWLALGIQSEIGRGDVETFATMDDPVLTEAWLRDGAETQRRAADRRSNVTGAPPLPEYADSGMERMAPGTSIFDPVLTEVLVRWYSAPGDTVMDPFAGGSVRGIVSAALERPYVGMDLRDEQVLANVAQVGPVLSRFPHAPTPQWFTGDSRTDLWLLGGPESADLILSCPPYADLEVYSDDPRDLSTMTYADFMDVYAEVIRQSVEMLRPDRFIAWVVGEARDRDGLSYGLVADTVQAFREAGAPLYNEAILINRAGTLPLRVTKQFTASRKMGRCHQHVLVFVKGDPRAAAVHAEEADRD